MERVRSAVALLAWLGSATVFAAETPQAPAPPARPRLIVQITVDQLRGDLALRYQNRFPPGGFRRFLDHGTWYADAQQPHAYLETVVGHTTLATATYPSRHGMIANSWFDSQTGKTVKNIEDDRYPLLPIREGETLKGAGVSPTAILTSTFSDELLIATGNHAKAFAVSGKDRGAVPMAGHSGKAFWYTTSNGCFVTSTFYYSEYPPWAKEWCDRRPADRYRNTEWKLLHDRSTYVYRDATNTYPKGTPAENNMEMLDQMRFNRTFPHPLPDSSGFYQTLTLSPDLDALTESFAEAVLRNERLGRGQYTDYLAVSFSVTDYVGHWFSPSSLESEDNILRLDRTLAQLFAAIDKEVGLSKTVIVLSADHGGAEYPEVLLQQKINTGRASQQEIVDTAMKAVRDKFGRDDLIRIYSAPYFYLNREKLGALEAIAVEHVIADAVTDLPGVFMGIPCATTTARGDTDAELVNRIRRNYETSRSGDVYVVEDPQWQVDNDDVPQLLQHNAPWAYDTFVPIAFTGTHVPTARVYRAVSTVDVAATLAAYAGTNQPSGCVGTPLGEVFGKKANEGK